MSAGKSWTARHACAAVVLALVGCGGGALTLTVTPPGTATRADGTTPAVITVKVARGDKAVPDSANGQVKVTTDKGQFAAFDPTATSSTPDDPNQQSTTVPVNSGAAKVQLFSLRSGQANVTFSYTDDNASTATKQVTVAFGTVSSAAASIQYVGADPATINLAGSGNVTTTQVTFKVLDASGSPAGDGIAVTFTLAQNPGGAAIAPLTATTANGTGQVQTVLSAGTIPGTVVITAAAGSVSTQSTPIAIAGGKVNFKNFTLACDAYTIAGFEYFGLSNTCTVFAADVNGQFVPNNQVTMMTEAGGVPSNIITEPPASPTDADKRGRASFPYQTQCPIPVDVAPNADDAPGRFISADGGAGRHNPLAFFNMCHKDPNGSVNPQYETRTVNPRDGKASLVAYTIGEECYIDRNGNGKFDPGEEDLANCDLGEPYLDENDNGKWDPPCVTNPNACDPLIPGGEPFYDYDSNGTWTPPDGKWDAQWPIWRKVDILWTGGTPGSGGQNNGINDVDPSPNLGTVAGCTPHTFNFIFSDVNGNIPAATVQSDSITLDCGTTRCTSISSGTAISASGRTASGLPYITIGYNDSYNCTNPPPPPPGFSINLTINRTLASAQGTAPTVIDSSTITGIASGVYQ